MIRIMTPTLPGESEARSCVVPSEARSERLSGINGSLGDEKTKQKQAVDAHYLAAVAQVEV